MFSDKKTWRLKRSRTPEWRHARRSRCNASWLLQTWQHSAQEWSWCQINLFYHKKDKDNTANCCSGITLTPDHVVIMLTWSPINSISGYFFRHSPSTWSRGNNISVSIYLPWDRLMQHKPCGSSRDASAHSACKQNEKQSCEEERNQPEPLLHILHVLLHRMECCLCANLVFIILRLVLVINWGSCRIPANLVCSAYVNPDHRSFNSETSNSRLKHIWEKRMNFRQKIYAQGKDLHFLKKIR